MTDDKESLKETVSIMARIIAKHIYEIRREYVAGYSESIPNDGDRQTNDASIERN